jgi:tRNA(His) 5'-end guanylyltransferase
VNDSLGDRIKSYEIMWGLVLPRRTWTVVRVDGRAFHTFTRGLQRPFDMALMDAMGDAMLALCRDMSGAVFAYQQSDEISVILQDFARESTQPYFDGKVQKMASISASVATAMFNKRWYENDHLAVFDSRVFSLPSRDEVRNYLLWRQRDAQRNAISMIASAHFSHKQLEGKSVTDRQRMLVSKGVNLLAYPNECLTGKAMWKEKRVGEPVTWIDRHGVEHDSGPVDRWVWTSGPAPTLDCQPGTFLDTILPINPYEEEGT